jgi:DNA-binding NtrC family response regulator
VRRILAADAPDPAVLARAVNRAGIEFFLAKPWEGAALDELAEALASGARSVAGAALAVPSRGGLAADARFPEIIGASGVIRELLELVARVADTESTALVTGETGTGKELVGRALHRASRRRQRVFCAVNSAAFPETLLESELFGHRRGAFTGASANKKGLFEHAGGGTVFLDEVAEMPLSMQAKLLRFLQTGEIRPVGDETVRRVDVRLVTATNKDLEREVEAGRFREDLYYRLAVIPIHVPALRERREDIPDLCSHFLRARGAKSGKVIEGIERDALQLLMEHPWPGNVRELENVIERGVALCRGPRIGVEDLPHRLRERPVLLPAQPVQSLPSLEKRHILDTLDRVGWNRKRAANLLQISTTTLWRRLKEFGIDRERAQERAANSRLQASG